LTREFYAALRREVMDGKAGLSTPELELLRGHYPIMMRPDRYPPRLVATIYAERRAPAVAAILNRHRPRVLDAGCAFGSECFLFAAAGAEVSAVDRDPRKIDVARRRQGTYEKLFGKRLTIRYAAEDLDAYDPPERELSLTWMASVLAAVTDQEALLARLHAATRPGGQVMLTDMNLLNPLFAFQEWRRRRRGARSGARFARQASFRAMFQRRDRRGGRCFPAGADGLLDDPQFFWWRTLEQLLRRTGFEPRRARYSGFVPPLPRGPDLSNLERLLARVPLLRCGGYFYLMSGVRR
jgi:SAM-dependent methyltransferase